MPNPTPKNQQNQPTKQKSKRKKQRQNKKKQSQSLSRGLPKDCYVNLLNDPFGNSPCRLGVGTMVSTELGSVVFRSTIPTNSDGSLMLFVLPSLGASVNPITYSTSTFTTAGAVATTGFSNIAQYPVTIGSESRIIVCGLRVTPMIPATSAPGIIYSGSLLGQSDNSLANLQPAQVATTGSMVPLVTSDPVYIKSRPIDNSAYEFLVSNTTGGNTFVYPHSIPTVVLSGFPAGASILFEIVIHFEYIPVYNNTTLREFNNEPDPPTASASFPSFDSFWNYAKRNLDPSAVIQAGSNVMSLMYSRNMYSLTRQIMGNPQRALR